MGRNPPEWEALRGYPLRPSRSTPSARFPPEALSEIDYLLTSNATRVGNLDFRLSPDDPESALQPPHFNQLAEVIEAAAGIEAGTMIDEHLMQLLRQGNSRGGARPKCTVEWNDALWIAKFPALGDTLNIPRIEYATMSLARLCGIEVPEIRLNHGWRPGYLSWRLRA